jgi:hypothetical protein
MELMTNQGLASDWINAESAKYLARLRAAEKTYQAKLQK